MPATTAEAPADAVVEETPATEAAATEEPAKDEAKPVRSSSFLFCSH